MPISVVVGGQYGSEGKGKVALEIAREMSARATIRVGGPNSGHSAVDASGKLHVLRQLPASCLAPNTLVVLPAGSLINPTLLAQELHSTGLDPARLIVDAKATVVLPKHADQEAANLLVERVGSTGSGTGAALVERISRDREHLLAGDHPDLARYCVADTVSILRDILNRRQRIVIEGTQGFGLSLWHGGSFPFATSRDTSASGFVSESGLAPHDVDDVVLTIRSYPIRVGGNSGPLPTEIDWPTLSHEAGLDEDYREYTSATKRVRRIGRFDERVVQSAIASNNPTRIAMNHVDYIGKSLAENSVRKFLNDIETRIGRKIDMVGFGPANLVSRDGHNNN